MHLEDYFDFLTPNDIRLKGTRVGIETILYDYIYRARTPEEIANTYHSVTLEQVYATILYYLHNKTAMTTYMQEWIEHGERMRKEQQRHPSAIAQKAREIREKWDAERSAHVPPIPYG